MKNKKGIIILSSVVVVCAVGFIVSPLIDWSVDSGSTSGNIGKTSRFSRKTATESITNMEELLSNDPSYKNSLVTAYYVMQTRAQQFGTLVDMSNEVAAGIPVFEGVLKEMNETREMVNNVNASLNQAGQDLEATLGGESCPEVAQSTINASLAYTSLQKLNKLANEFIDVADNYLKDAPADDRLMFVRDQWVDYQAMTAALEGDEKLAKELQKKGALLNSDQTVSALRSFDAVNQLSLVCAGSLANNLSVENNLSNSIPSEVMRSAQVIYSNVSMQTLEAVSSQKLSLNSQEAAALYKNFAQEQLANAFGEDALSLKKKLRNGIADEAQLAHANQEALANQGTLIVAAPLKIFAAYGGAMEALSANTANMVNQNISACQELGSVISATSLNSRVKEVNFF